MYPQNRVSGVLRGFLPLSLGMSRCPPCPRFTGRPPLPEHSALTSLEPPLWRPRGPSWRHQQCLPKPPCCCLGSRAPRRGSSGEGTEGVLKLCPQAATSCYPPHILASRPPTFPGLVFSLPWVFNAGLWNGGGGNKSYEIVSLLPPTTPSISYPSYWPPSLQRVPSLSPATRRFTVQSKELGAFCCLSPTSKRSESLSPLESTVQISCCLNRETEAQRDVAYAGSH